MPQELPGFYYDSEKNRYFPLKGPIPGSSRKRKSPPPPSPAKGKDIYKCMKIRTSKLLQARELCGQLINTRKGKLSFQMEYQKRQASQPMICKYGTKMADNALELMSVGVERLEGTVETDILLTGSVNGSLCLFEVGKVGEEFNHGLKFLPDRVWPPNSGDSEGCIAVPGLAWRNPGAILNMQSNVSCIKMCQKHHQPVETASSTRALITTLGSEISGGTVYILNLSEPLDTNSYLPMLSRLSEITSFDYTVWTADCNFDGSRAAIGTNMGAALVNIDTGRTSWSCRCKSDVFSLQLDQSGNTILCGLRNGAIVSIDARQRPENFSSRLPTHQIPCHPHKTSSGRAKKFHQERFKLKGNMCHSNTICMPSSISCITSLDLYDQYFLASSMDGSIKLYDNRLTQRGAVQSYEGNINSHTRIQLGVDPSESIIMSGGEDCYLRLWSIKSGEMLFQDKFMNTIPSVVCWPRTRGIHGLQNRTQGAWLGSQDGLYHLGWPV